MAKFIVKKGPAPGNELEVDRNVVIGRGNDADIQIPDATMSRQHAMLMVGRDQYVLTDLGSGNGTKVNGIRITGPVKLNDRDQVQMGNVLLVFRTGESADARARGSEAPELDTGVDTLPADTAEELDLPAQEEFSLPDENDFDLPLAEEFALPGAEGPGSVDASIVTIMDGEAGGGQAIREEIDAANPVGSLLTEGDNVQALLEMSRRLQLVYEVGEAISTTLNEDELLNLIMKKLLEVFPQADRGFIMVYDAEQNRLLPKVARTRTGEATQITISRQVVREVISKKKGILSDDAMGDDRFSGGQSIIQYGIRSVICVPMIAKGEVIGVIHVDASDPTKAFAKDDMALLLGLASQAALAISNARLHQKVLKQELMQQDLALATRIQQRFLPESPPAPKGYHFHDSYSAAFEVGGDYYDFIELPHNHVGIVVGDVSGKGVSAALYMAKLSSDVRYHAAGKTEPKEILAPVSLALAKDVEEGMFVTLIFVSLNTATGEMKIANAGHFPPMIRKADGRVITSESAKDPPLGIMEDVEFTQESIQLECGDSVALFTDGIVEAMNPNNEEFGLERLVDAMRRSSGNPGEMLNDILKAVKKFIRDAPQSDDLTLVCFGRSHQDITSATEPG